MKKGNKPKQTKSRSGPGPRPHSQKPGKTKIKGDLYGFHAVREAWLNPVREITALYVTEQALKNFASVLQEGEGLNLQRPAPLKIDRHELDRAMPPGSVHQGLAIACVPLKEVFLQDVMIQAQSQPRSLLIMLDQVTDPHNVGAILRSACGLGADGVILQSRHAPEMTGALAKAACGALEHIPVIYETNLSRALEMLQEGGYFAYGLDERGEDAVEQVKPADKSVLVLGAEGAGIRPLIKDHCDQLIRLNMPGPLPSLNVSNAAAVALYNFVSRAGQ